MLKNTNEEIIEKLKKSIFKKNISNMKREMAFEIYAYFLMSNHVHILLKEKTAGKISLIMKRLLMKYARWYNINTEKAGH